MKSRYDGAVAMHRQMTKNHTNTTISNANNSDIYKVFANVMWLTIPKIMAGSQFLATKARVSLRVNRNYGESEKPASNALNHHNPVFSFSTVSLAPSINHLATAKSALDLINVVPYPYYGYSTYEGNAQDARVRITNLSQNSIISVHNLGGSLVPTLNKNSQLNFVDWNIKTMPASHWLRAHILFISTHHK